MHNTKASEFYKTGIGEILLYNNKGEALSEKTKKSMLTTNWKLLNEAGVNRIHFNIPKLVTVIGYDKNDKDSIGIWNAIAKLDTLNENLIPKKISGFLEINKMDSKNILEENYLPF